MLPMPHPGRSLATFVLSVAAMVLTAIGAGAAHRQQPKPPAKVDPAIMAKSVGDMTADEEQQFSDAAEATIERVCVACHPFENIIKTRRTTRDWNDQVAAMKGRGAPGTDPDFTTVKKYLIRYYGIVRVNTATADELTSVLGLSPKAAAAVLEYRTAHGKISDMETLLKIDGVDKAKIEEQPEALRFD
jgi:competence ComEA-like helix-hairpin-helix protein